LRSINLHPIHLWILLKNPLILRRHFVQ